MASFQSAASSTPAASSCFPNANSTPNALGNVLGMSSQQQSSFSGYGNHSDGEAPVICSAILEDHAFIREDLPKAAILTLTGQFVTVVIMRTPYSRVQLRVQVTNDL